MIKVIIANNNDILYNSLSKAVLQYEGKIEIINVPTDELKDLIYRIKPKENLIILDSCSSVSFCNNMLKYIVNRMDKTNVIILVMNSKTANNIISQQEIPHHLFFRKERTNFSTLDVINIVANSIKDTLEIEKRIDDILWKLGFTTYFKGSMYLKDTILLAYNDNNLLQDMNTLVKKVAEKYNIENAKVVRSAMDKSLNNVLNFIDNSNIYNVFGDYYDGRKISVKYLIDLCIRYLENKDIAV